MIGDVHRDNKDRHCQANIVQSSQTLFGAAGYCPVGTDIVHVTVSMRIVKI
jgi:hypothetical protein